MATVAKEGPIWRLRQMLRYATDDAIPFTDSKH